MPELLRPEADNFYVKIACVHQMRIAELHEEKTMLSIMPNHIYHLGINHRYDKLTKYSLESIR